MAQDAKRSFDKLYGGRLFLHGGGGTYWLADGLGSIRLFGKEVDVMIRISPEYPCRVDLADQQLIIEKGDNWDDVWRQLLGSLGAAVEYGIGAEKMFNSMVAKYRLAGHPSRQYVARIGELERENQLLNQLLVDLAQKL